MFVINASLPFNAVEVAPIQANVVRFYSEEPTERPAGLPATFVLVRVFAYVSPERMAFVGWFWLDAEVVNQLHDPANALQVRL